MPRNIHPMPDNTVILPRALLLDMDGTLTEPLLDFARIKADMGIGDRPILEALAEMDDCRRQIAQDILFRHEEQAAARSTLSAGCHELLALLCRRGIAAALITRNSRSSVETVLARHGLALSCLVTREDAPPKPSPRPLHLACEKLRVRPDEAWMVGDGQYDIEAGLAAGARPVWISHGRERPFAAQPWRQCQNLHELRQMLECG